MFIYKSKSCVYSALIKNLPKVNTSRRCLYIHLRSGDIFINNRNRWYSQPPLCFYQAILNNFNFNEIYML